MREPMLEEPEVRHEHQQHGGPEDADGMQRVEGGEHVSVEVVALGEDARERDQQRPDDEEQLERAVVAARLVEHARDALHEDDARQHAVQGKAQTCE